MRFRRTHGFESVIRRVSVALALAWTLALGANPGFAQPVPEAPSALDAERARLLKRRGDEAMDALRYGDALAAYRQVYAVTKNPALLYNQGRAYQALGDFAQALTFLERFATEAPLELKARVPQLPQLLADVRARVAKIVVRCNVVGAEVTLGDRVLGTTSQSSEFRVTSGRATISVRADGYETFTRDVELPGGGSVSLDVELISKRTSTILVVRSNVSAATVFVDDEAQGQTPVELAIRAGSHGIRVEHDGYEPVRTQVAVQSGERKELDLELSKAAPPIYAKWWFWTAVGVVAVGATVTIIAATTERATDSGSLGRMSAPLVRW